MDNLLNLLKKFGFTEYETKVYVALLKNGSGTGYEVSKNSSVPRSKVYNILEMLMSKGCVVISKDDKPVKYAAIPVDEFVKNIKYSMDNVIDDIKFELNSFNNNIDLNQIWYIKGYENIFNKCRHMILNAKSEAYIQVWREDLPEIEEEISIIQEKLHNVVVILYSMNHDYTTKIKHFYKHGFEKSKFEESGGRWITLVTDSNEMLFGNIKNEKNAEIIWTENSPIVFLAKENVMHDAYCLKLIDTLGDDLKSKFGEDLLGVRKIF